MSIMLQFLRREVEKGLSMYADLVGIKIDTYADAIDVKLVSRIMCEIVGYGLVFFWVI